MPGLRNLSIWGERESLPIRTFVSAPPCSTKTASPWPGSISSPFTYTIEKTAAPILSGPDIAKVFEAHPLLYVSTSIPASSSFSSPQVITTIPQAIYQDCNLDGQSCSGLAGDTATSQLDKIAAANFSVVLNYR